MAVAAAAAVVEVAASVAVAAASVVVAVAVAAAVASAAASTIEAVAVVVVVVAAVVVATTGNRPELLICTHEARPVGAHSPPGFTSPSTSCSGRAWFWTSTSRWRSLPRSLPRIRELS